MSKIKIWFICLKYSIYNWSLNEETGMVDVDGSVDLSWYNLTELPLNFGNVTGDFWCDNNKLTTLKGAPISVGGHFRCHFNKLTSLEHCPQEIGGDFNVFYNNITTRNKIPNVGNSIYCDKNMKWIF